MAPLLTMPPAKVETPQPQPPTTIPAPLGIERVPVLVIPPLKADTLLTAIPLRPPPWISPLLTMAPEKVETPSTRTGMPPAVMVPALVMSPRKVGPVMAIPDELPIWLVVSMLIPPASVPLLSTAPVMVLPVMVMPPGLMVPVLLISPVKLVLVTVTQSTAPGFR
jgi:hypothetical protein